jgi:hypothetical protein
MLFTKRQDFTPAQAFALGDQVTFELTREFHIAEIFVELSFTIASGEDMATAAADGITGLLARAQVSVSDGAQNRNVVDVSGQGLLERELNTVGTLDVATMTQFRANPDDQAVILRYPIRFLLAQLPDPIASVFLLPAPRFNSNPVVTLTFATQSQLDTHATPTLALTTPTVRLVVNRRQVNRSQFPTYNTELSEISTPFPTTGNSQLTELQIPGSYTAVLLRDYASLTSRAFIETAGGENRIQLLGTVVRRFRCADVLAENQRSMVNYIGTGVPNNIAGAANLDFLADKSGTVGPDLGSVLDGNILQATGARVQLLQDITGGANIRRSIVTHRVYGNLSQLKF